jgi:hypothetical protein
MQQVIGHWKELKRLQEIPGLKEAAEFCGVPG